MTLLTVGVHRRPGKYLYFADRIDTSTGKRRRFGFPVVQEPDGTWLCPQAQFCNTTSRYLSHIALNAHAKLHNSYEPWPTERIPHPNDNLEEDSDGTELEVELTSADAPSSPQGHMTPQLAAANVQDLSSPATHDLDSIEHLYEPHSEYQQRTAQLQDAPLSSQRTCVQVRLQNTSPGM